MIIGSDHEASIERIYVKYLREHQIEVYHFASQRIFDVYYNKNLFNKMLFKFGISKIYQVINKLLRAEIIKNAPDILWVFKGMEILPDTLNWAKKQGIKIINYNPDNPFIFSGKGSGNKNVTNSIPLYHQHLTYDREVAKRISQDLNIETHILPFGFDISADLYSICENQEEIKKVCFIGNPDRHRVNFLNSIAKAGISIDVYGHNWERFKLDSKIQAKGAVYNNQYFSVLRKYRVQLNIMRQHNLNSHNMRTFEAPAVGAIMLAPHTPDHIAFFKDGEDFFSYKNTEECVSVINKILNLSDIEAQKIRNNARKKSLESGYSYENRTREALHFLLNLHES